MEKVPPIDAKGYQMQTRWQMSIQHLFLLLQKNIPWIDRVFLFVEPFCELFELASLVSTSASTPVSSNKPLLALIFKMEIRLICPLPSLT